MIKPVHHIGTGLVSPTVNEMQHELDLMRDNRDEWCGYASRLEARIETDRANASKFYRVQTAMDGAVCPECMAMDQKVFAKGQTAGVLPVHSGPHDGEDCRCSWVPCDKDGNDLPSPGLRLAGAFRKSDSVRNAIKDEARKNEEFAAGIVPRIDAIDERVEFAHRRIDDLESGASRPPTDPELDQLKRVVAKVAAGANLTEWLGRQGIDIGKL